MFRKNQAFGQNDWTIVFDSLKFQTVTLLRLVRNVEMKAKEEFSHFHLDDHPSLWLFGTPLGQ